LNWVKKTTIVAGDWTPESRRSGLIGVKVGMFPVWNEFFERVVTTIIWVPPNQVLQQRTLDKDGYISLQLGAVEKKLKKTTKPMLGHFQKAGVSPKHKIREFKVTPDCLLPVGHQLDVRHFQPGQYLDTVSYSKGKGFQGAMKRHHFSGGPASHGSSKFHRMVGSIGTQGHG
jgi:large subunit ribosomal protein L3